MLSLVDIVLDPKFSMCADFVIDFACQNTRMCYFIAQLVVC